MRAAEDIQDKMEVKLPPIIPLLKTALSLSLRRFQYKYYKSK